MLRMKQLFIFWFRDSFKCDSIKEASHKWQKINNQFTLKLISLLEPKEVQLKQGKITILT